MSGVPQCYAHFQGPLPELTPQQQQEHMEFCKHLRTKMDRHGSQGTQNCHFLAVHQLQMMSRLYPDLDRRKFLDFCTTTANDGDLRIGKSEHNDTHSRLEREMCKSFLFGDEISCASLDRMQLGIWRLDKALKSGTISEKEAACAVDFYSMVAGGGGVDFVHDFTQHNCRPDASMNSEGIKNVLAAAQPLSAVRAAVGTLTQCGCGDAEMSKMFGFSGDNGKRDLDNMFHGKSRNVDEKLQTVLSADFASKVADFNMVTAIHDTLGTPIEQRGTKLKEQMNKALAAADKCDDAQKLAAIRSQLNKASPSSSSATGKKFHERVGKLALLKAEVVKQKSVAQSKSQQSAAVAVAQSAGRSHGAASAAAGQAKHSSSSPPSSGSSGGGGGGYSGGGGGGYSGGGGGGNHASMGYSQPYRPQPPAAPQFHSSLSAAASPTNPFNAFQQHYAVTNPGASRSQAAQAYDAAGRKNWNQK